MEEKSWSRYSGRHLGSIWEASGKHLGGICEASGNIWEALGETCVVGVAKITKSLEIIGDQYVIVKINMFHIRSPEVLALPGFLKVGVTKYNFLQ